MKKLGKLIRNRWFVAVVGFAALGALIWFAGPQIAVSGQVPLASPMARLFFFACCLAIWALNLLRVELSVKRANAGLLRDAAGAAGQNEAERLSREEVDVLTQRFDEALQVFRKSARGKGRPNVYELPWYIVIGPPGAGKTTALVNSGLRFPLAEKFGKGAVKGVGGTRNCDWWFTEEAVLLDTAGRFVTQDSHAEADRAAWNGFIDLLLRHRRRRPINGALVAISVSDLLSQNRAERTSQITAIRQRLQELNEKLRITFPVYVIFTKCDLIPGFSEFFDDLGREEREQVWGMTFDYGDGPGGEALATLPGEFDALVDRLNLRVRTRMEQERDIERKTRLFTFPQQFDALKPLLSEFLDEIFTKSRYQEDTLLRGVYFTSGTQEGAPIDRVMATLGRTLGVAGEASAPRYAGEGKSYFVTRLFRDLVFAESELAGANRKLEIQRFWLQRGAYAGAVLLTALAAVAWSISFSRNQIFLSRADAAWKEFEAVDATELPADPQFTDLLEPLNAMREVTEVYAPVSESVPFSMRMGLYQGARVTRAARSAYRGELQRKLLPVVERRSADILYSSESDTEFQYQALKNYLMLGDSEHLDPPVISDWLAEDWRRSYSREPEVQGHLQQHLGSMLELGFDPVELDTDLVEASRTNLRMAPRAELLYSIRKAEKLAADDEALTLASLYGREGGRLFEHTEDDPAAQRIPGMFTYDGYYGSFIRELDDILEWASRESWVLDAEPQPLTLPERTRMLDDIRGLYFEDYRQIWLRMLANLRIIEFDSLAHAANAADIASSSASPLRRVLEVTARNTTLIDPRLRAGAGEVADEVASRGRFGRLFDKLSSEPVAAQVQLAEQTVDDQFAQLNALTRPNEAGTTALASTLDLLAQVYAELDGLSGGFGTDIATMVSEGGGAASIKRLQAQAARHPLQLREWLQQFAYNTRRVSFATAREQINRDWRADVLPQCVAAVDGRYPFVGDATREATLMDFGRLFAPGGALDSFFSRHIEPLTEAQGGRLRWKSVDGVTIGMPTAVLDLFQDARAIRDMYFEGGGMQPSINFRLKPVYLDANVTTVNLSLEGQVFTYRHGPQFLQQAVWPKLDGDGQVTLEFVDNSGAPLVRSFEGSWAWFRLLDASDVVSRTGDIAVASFEHRGRQSSWELHAQSVSNPFLAEQLASFRCRERL
ncbi:MAG: type VI secretion system membrane subunit TssM [Pseudomonadota bacterium]